MSERDSFGSKIGAIFVAAGSAIGLGSIWRFPYVVGENGGGAFILLYILCVLILGIPVMLAEFAIGSYCRKGCFSSYRTFKGRWYLLGVNGILCATLISGYYYIVAGWSMGYLADSVTGALYQGSDFHQNFMSFCGSWRQTAYAMAFILATHLIVVMGVQKGLERMCKIMMPALFVMLIVMIVSVSLMPGAKEGYRFLFHPDFSKALSPNTIICAIGQAFFSLSIGIGCMIAYSSYFKKGTDLTHTSISVSAMTTVIAIMCGMIIFPAVFTYPGLKAEAGPSLIFETLPYIFAGASLGRVWSTVFFLLIVIAALTSTISFHEVLTQYMQERHSFSRKNAARTTSFVSAALTLVCINFPLLFDWFDAVSANIVMPLGGLATAIFAGWFFGRERFRNQISQNGKYRARLFGVLIFLLRWICPLLLITAIVQTFLSRFNM